MHWLLQKIKLLLLILLLNSINVTKPCMSLHQLQFKKTKQNDCPKTQFSVLIIIDDGNWFNFNTVSNTTCSSCLLNCIVQLHGRNLLKPGLWNYIPKTFECFSYSFCAETRRFWHVSAIWNPSPWLSKNPVFLPNLPRLERAELWRLKIVSVCRIYIRK